MTPAETAQLQAYDKTGGFRFEAEQIRKIGQAITALGTQRQSRPVSGPEHAAMADLTRSLENVRQAHVAVRATAQP